MTLPNYKELDEINDNSSIETALLILQKKLLELRIKKSARETVKPHLFKHSKRRIAQLKFKQSLL
jgi:ribosomal protein L29